MHERLSSGGVALSELSSGDGARLIRVVLFVLASFFGAACATGGPVLVQPGSKLEAAKTAAEHRQRCPPSTTLKQSRYADESLKLLVCMDGQGRQHGPAVMFAEAGFRTVAMNYRHGVAEGPTTMWHPSGAVFMTGAYADGLEDGRWVAQMPDGRVIGEYTLRRGTGVRTRWHPNGKRQQVVALRDGVPQGEAKQWHDNGELAMTAVFEDGKPQGTVKRYHTDGTRAGQSTYVDGRLDGEEMTWGPGGKLRSVKRWRAGKLHGKSMLFGADGSFRTAACFVDDRMVWDINALAAAAAVAADSKGKETVVMPDAHMHHEAAKARRCP